MKKNQKNFFQHSIKAVTLSLLLVFLSACSFMAETEDATKDWSAKELYDEAKAYLDSGSYELAVEYYEILESRYPLGTYAQQAQLDTIYAYYRSDEVASALAAADRFIRYNPRHPFIDYVYYLKGLANFNENFGFLQRYLPIDLATRDQAAAKQSFEAFNELVKRYPESKYSPDAVKRMEYLRGMLAQYEVYVANYYLERKAYLAAANRAQYVIQHYDRTASVPDAMVIQAKAYHKMGMKDLVADLVKVMQLNYPDNIGYQEIRDL